MEAIAGAVQCLEDALQRISMELEKELLTLAQQIRDPEEKAAFLEALDALPQRLTLLGQDLQERLTQLLDPRYADYVQYMVYTRCAKTTPYGYVPIAKR